MRRLKIIEHISLDGVIQISNCDDGFPYDDWIAPYRTAAGAEAVLEAHSSGFDLLLGRNTYDAWSNWWPKAPHGPLADGINTATKFVATHRPETLEWGPYVGIGPYISEDIRRLKSLDGPDIIIWGSSTLTSKVLEQGLVDEVLLIVYPALLGTGKRFFAEGTPACSLKLIDTKAMPSGVIFTTYNSSGLLKAE